jgi:hypothetical protein
MSERVNNILFEVVQEGTSFLVLANGQEIFASKNKVEAERYFFQTIKDFS